MKKDVILALLIIWICILFVGCSGCNSSEAVNINPADTIYLGDLREKFKGDSVFFNIVAPNLLLDRNQYFWAETEISAIEKGLTKEYYKKVKEEIAATNEAIRHGVMKGANMKRVYDFQK